MNLAAVHTFLQLSPDLEVYWTEVKTVGWPETWLTVAQSSAMWAGTLPCQQTSLLESGPMTVLFNVMETALFCCQSLKINSSTVKEYFLTKFCNSFRDIFRIQCTILLGFVETWHFYQILSVVYFFPGHSVDEYHEICRGRSLDKKQLIRFCW